METIKRIWKWLVQKAPEVKQLDHRDAQLVVVVVRIQQQATGKQVVPIPLFQIKLIHPIHRGAAVEKTNQRMQAIIDHKDELLQTKLITQDFLKDKLPSVTWIKAVRDDDGKYIVFEGNGRVAALQEVFTPADQMMLEIEIFDFPPDSDILDQVRQVRTAYNLN